MARSAAARQTLEKKFVEAILEAAKAALRGPGRRGLYLSSGVFQQRIGDPIGCDLGLGRDGPNYSIWCNDLKLQKGKSFATYHHLDKLRGQAIELFQHLEKNIVEFLGVGGVRSFSVGKPKPSPSPGAGRRPPRATPNNDRAAASATTKPKTAASTKRRASASSGRGAKVRRMGKGGAVESALRAPNAEPPPHTTCAGKQRGGREIGTYPPSCLMAESGKL